MEKFLESVATYINQNYEGALHNICLVFPNRRSGVFFNAYLRKLLSKPVIGPKIITVNDFITGFTELRKPDRLNLIALLYDVFREHSKTTESFDDFYFWGEMLLADFDDVDKYLVDASALFQNIADLKEIESRFDFLDESQKEVLRRFWGTLGKWEGYKNKEEFLKIWKILWPVYTGFKKKLTESGIAYDGMIYRELAEKVQAGESLPLPGEKYIITGLNALNECEKKIFRYLKSIGKGIFLWDYDKFYLAGPKNEAGHFIRENTVAFPPPGDFLFQNEGFNSEKKIEFIAVASSGGQAQVIPDAIKDHTPQFDKAAVVLANEDLLFPVLGAIPESAGPVNVTMGYPVKNSGIAGFIQLLAALIKNIRNNSGEGLTVYYRHVADILNHQLLGGVETEKVAGFLESVKRKNRIYIDLDELDFSGLHKAIFQVPRDVSRFTGYFLSVLKQLYHYLHESQSGDKTLAEVIVSVYKALERLGNTVDEVTSGSSRAISTNIYFRLFSQYLNQVTVSFEGEPLSGLQVMGILETRCLDFDNVLIIGFNEDFWPRASVAPSFIPYNLRVAFGLPSIDNQDAMFAYYFYRLVQRAGNVTAVYNTAKDGIYTGELSRFGYQLIYDSGHHISLRNFEYRFITSHTKKLSGKNTPEVMEILLNRFSADRSLSPSALNMYIVCRYKFFLRYIAGLPEPDEVSEEIDSRLFGNIFHRAAEELYNHTQGILTGEWFDKKIKDNPAIESAIRKAFASEYFKIDESESRRIEFDGHARIVFGFVRSYLKQLLNYDKQFIPIEIISLEEKYVWNFPVNLGSRQVKIPIGGIIDRLDRAGGRLRAIDYKTGNVKSLSFKDVDSLFDGTLKETKKEAFQALLYCLVLKKTRFSKEDVSPGIYAVRKLFDNSFSPELKYNSNPLLFETIESEFEERLGNLIQEIFSEGAEFLQTEVTAHCSMCPYKIICHRE